MRVHIFAVVFVGTGAVACVDGGSSDSSDFSVTQEVTDCGNASRWVTHVCTHLGPADGCDGYGDFCVPLCDNAVRCTTVDTEQVRQIDLFGVGPNSVCVICKAP